MDQIPGVDQIPRINPSWLRRSWRLSRTPGILCFADSSRAGVFQATLPVLTPGFPHRVTLRYPSAMPIDLRIDVVSAIQNDRPTQSFRLSGSAETDDPSGWKTYSFIHYPSRSDQIKLTNLSESASVAFESISVQAGPNLLTDLTPPSENLRSTVLRLENTGMGRLAIRGRHGQAHACRMRSCDNRTVSVMGSKQPGPRLRVSLRHEWRPDSGKLGS